MIKGNKDTDFCGGWGAALEQLFGGGKLGYEAPVAPVVPELTCDTCIHKMVCYYVKEERQCRNLIHYQVKV